MKGRQFLACTLSAVLLLTAPSAAYGRDVRYDQLLRGQIADLKAKRQEVRKQRADIESRLNLDGRVRWYAYLLDTNNLDPLRAQLDPVELYHKMPATDQESMKAQVCDSLAQQEVAKPGNTMTYKELYAQFVATIDMEAFVRANPQLILTDQVVRTYYSTFIGKVGVLSEDERQDYEQTKRSMVEQVDSQIRLLQARGQLINNQQLLQHATLYLDAREAERNADRNRRELQYEQQRLAASLSSDLDRAKMEEQVDYLDKKQQLLDELRATTEGYSQQLGHPDLAQAATEQAAISDEQAIAQAQTNRLSILTVREERLVAEARSVRPEIDQADARLLQTPKELEIEVYQLASDLATIHAQRTQLQSAIKAMNQQITWLESRPGDQNGLSIAHLKLECDQRVMDDSALADQEQLLLYWRQLLQGIGPEYKGVQHEN